MDLLQFITWIIQVLATCYLGVMRTPVPGVTEVNRTLSCLEELKIPIYKGCHNTFMIGQMSYAVVEGANFSVQGPFRFLKAEGAMLVKVQDCVDFTHRSVCNVDEIREREEITHYHVTTTPCSKEDSPSAAAALQACVPSVVRSIVPGVTEVNRTLSCFEELKILITKGCRNTFMIEQMTYAVVEDTNVSVQEPFHFLEAECLVMVKLLDCVDYINFTHSCVCDVDENREREEIIHYQVIPFSKEDNPSAAAVLQGSLLSLLLTMAVTMIMMFC